MSKLFGVVFIVVLYSLIAGFFLPPLKLASGATNADDVVDLWRLTGRVNGLEQRILKLEGVK